MSDESLDIIAMEKEQIKGARRTDFILSAEIIVSALGATQGADIYTQTMVVSLIALLAIAGVYGIVSAIVKFDDAGLALLKSADDNAWGPATSLGRPWHSYSRS